MPQDQGQVVARVKGPSGEVFPSLARAIIGMQRDGEVRRAQAVEMLTDMIHAFAVHDGERWTEPPMELALNPLVFEALQYARIRLMPQPA